MGGNAFKNVDIKKLTLDEYNLISTKIGHILDDNNIEFRLPKKVKEKNSFGDIDFLLKKSSMDNPYNIIKNIFNNNNFFRNDNIYSVTYNNYQIDFMIIDDYYWDMSYMYYSYMPLNHIIGSIFKQNDFKFNQYGLRYKKFSKILNKNNEILISKNPKEIYKFILSNNNFMYNSFETYNDMFELICKSKYFNINVINKRQRHPIYIKFIDFLNNCDIKNNNITKKQFMEDVQNFFKIDLESFNEVIEEKELIYVNYKKKFNANLIKNIYPNISNAKLGKIMMAYKMQFSNEDEFIKHILYTSKKDIIKEIKKI